MQLKHHAQQLEVAPANLIVASLLAAHNRRWSRGEEAKQQGRKQRQPNCATTHFIVAPHAGDPRPPRFLLPVGCCPRPLLSPRLLLLLRCCCPCRCSLPSLPQRLPTHQCHHSHTIMSSRSDKRSSIKQTHSSKDSNSGDDQRQLRSGAVIQLPAAAQKAKRPLTPQQLWQRQQAAAARAQQRAVIAQQRRQAVQLRAQQEQERQQAEESKRESDRSASRAQRRRLLHQ